MKLLDQEIILPGVVQKTWRHTDGAGNDNITVENVQDVEPIFNQVKLGAQANSKDMPLLAQIPVVVIEETSRVCATNWGMRVKDAYAEIVNNKTGRAKQVWAILVTGRDYRKLQTKHYA